MTRILFYALLIIVALPAAALAQGSGAEVERPASPSRNAELDRADQPFIVYRSMTGKIVEVNAEERVIVVEEKEGGKRYQFRLDRKTKLKADKQTLLSERKELALSDFEIGQLVKVTFIPAEKRVTEVRARREKS